MRVTIFKAHNLVAVNGVQHHVDCTKLPGDFHVLQWYDTHGELEYASTMEDGKWQKKPNDDIADLGAYQGYLAAWGAEDERVRRAAEEAKAKAEAEANDAA